MTPNLWLAGLSVSRRVLSYLLFLLLLTPFITLLSFSFSAMRTGEWTFVEPTLLSLLNALLYGSLATVICAVWGWLMAYGLSFFRFFLRRMLERLVLLPLLFPPFVVAAIYKDLLASTEMLPSWLAALGGRLDFSSATGFVFSMTVTLLPYVYLLCRTTFIHHGGPFLEVGQSTGLGLAHTTYRVLLPLSKPALLLSAGLVLMETLSDYGTATVLSVDSGSVALHDLWFNRDQAPLAARVGLAFILLLLLLLVLLQRRAISRSFSHLLAGSSGAPRSLGDPGPCWRVLLFLLCLLPILLGFVIPTMVILYYFFLTLAVIDLTPLYAVCTSTLSLLLATSLLGLFFATVITYANHAHPDRITRFVLRWMSFSYILPAMIFALGILAGTSALCSTASRFSDASSFLILAFALGVRFLCFLLIPIQAGLSYLPRRLDELAFSLSLGPLRTALRVHVPHLRRYVLLGLLLVVLQTLKEVTVTVVLHPFSFQPLVMKIYSLIRIDMLPESSAWVIALLLLGLYPLLSCERLLFEPRGKKEVEKCSS